MYTKLRAMTNEELMKVWAALWDYDPQEFYDENHSITMDEWAQAVYSEMSRRGLSQTAGSAA